MNCVLCSDMTIITTDCPTTQMKSICANKTQIEEWIVGKARRRRRDDENAKPFVFPYNLGRWKNFTEVRRSIGSCHYTHVHVHVCPELVNSIYTYCLFSQVINFSGCAKGDGIHWPVVEGCTQYTLTVSLACISEVKSA